MECIIDTARYSHARVLLRIGNDVAIGTGPWRLAHPEEGVRSGAVVGKGFDEQRRLVHRVDLTLRKRIIWFINIVLYFLLKTYNNSITYYAKFRKAYVAQEGSIYMKYKTHLNAMGKVGKISNIATVVGFRWSSSGGCG